MPVLYLSVDDFVSAQCARLSEAFPTNFAHERPCARVHGHVAGQVVVRVKHLSRRGGGGIKIIIIIIVLIIIIRPTTFP